MSTSEQRIKEAFGAVKMPEDLKESTLKAVEAKRQLQDSAEDKAYIQECNNLEAINCVVVKSEFSLSQAFSSKSFKAKKRPRSAVPKAIFAAAACLLVAVIGFGGLSAWATETAVVGIDLNPSIELGLNRFDIVVDARAFNEEGEAVLEQLALRGKNYDEALALITQSDSFLSYVTDESFVDIYVMCTDDRQSSFLLDRGQKTLSTLPCEGGCNRVTSELRSEAQSCGMGVGRYTLAQILLSLDSSLTMEDCRSLSRQELRMRIAEIDPNNEYARQNEGHGKGNSGAGHNGKRHQGRDFS